MTRNPNQSANADDSWEQLEADLFGVEVGKEHTAAERVASEPALPVPDQPSEAVAKPIEEDDFGDFGAGVVDTIEGGEPPPRRSSAPPRPRAKPAPKSEPAPPKPLPIEPAPAFNLSDLDEGPTDEELDEASDEDDEELDEEGAPEAEGDDPYWDPLANWNWQEDDSSRKATSESGQDRGRPRGRSDRPDRGGPRGRGGRGERRPHQASESHTADDDRGLSTPRRPYQEPVAEPAAEAAQTGPEATAPEDTEQHRPGGKSRRQDRRRSRRHSQPSSVEAEEPVLEQEPVDQTVEDAWPPVDEADRPATVEVPHSRVPRLDELDPDFEEESAEAEEEPSEAGESDDRGPRRRRGRRRRRRFERPASGQSETAADEDIKHLEDEADVENDEFSDAPAAEETAADNEESESDRPSRSRRPRRRRRGGRPDRPERPAPAPRARQEFDDDDEVEEDDEVVASDADDEFDEDQDREFVEEDVPQSRRPGRSRRSTSDTPFVRHIEDDDEDSEPEPAVSYEDVPSWEEAISYLLNPSMVEGGGGGGGGERGDRGDRPPRGERSSRPPRRGPRRDS